MPYYSFREVKTPLSLLSIRFFKEMEHGDIFIKIGSKHRKLFLRLENKGEKQKRM